MSVEDTVGRMILLTLVDRDACRNGKHPSGLETPICGLPLKTQQRGAMQTKGLLTRGYVILPIIIRLSRVSVLYSEVETDHHPMWYWYFGKECGEKESTLTFI